jgi:nitrate/nitrite-specific signal transduction histidine kinase
MFKIIANEKKKCRELEETIKAKNKSIAFLYLHAQELAEIKKDKERKDEILNDAKTNEEIAAVVASIVANNNKLCNDTKK